jgi:hypothetical protein
MITNFFNQRRRIKMSAIKILKKLKEIYGYALRNKEWRIALQAREQQASYRAEIKQRAKIRSVFEKQNLPSQPLPKVRRIEDRAQEQPKVFVAARKMYPALKKLEHPPPARL